MPWDVPQAERLAAGPVEFYREVVEQGSCWAISSGGIEQRSSHAIHELRDHQSTIKEPVHEFRSTDIIIICSSSSIIIVVAEGSGDISLDRQDIAVAPMRSHWDPWQQQRRF